ncbi:hypothetical protein [Floricoccus penangensis]|uniref:hypothetical protein n=1 Tax=Floricoccus penangensis TaxID=1859475 RepID=UPI00203E687B|nr:hypothetical protein [Floricoccus penangensis]URZ86802.1 hypothetical protein KIW23_06855 [Floricoccus penangensis]
MTKEELNEKLVVAEDALAELNGKELNILLEDIGYSPKAIDILLQYQEFVKEFREKPANL